MAIVDKFPLIPGQIVVLSKEHLSSNLLELSGEQMQELTQAAYTTAKLMERLYPVERVALRVEGLEISHLHAKLYPVKAGTGLSGRTTELTEIAMAEVAARFAK